MISPPDRIFFAGQSTYQLSHTSSRPALAVVVILFPELSRTVKVQTVGPLGFVSTVCISSSALFKNQETLDYSWNQLVQCVGGV